MLLDRINSPADLRRLDQPALEQLASEIRSVIIEQVIGSGSGHLGSNLGAVELANPNVLAVVHTFPPSLKHDTYTAVAGVAL